MDNAIRAITVYALPLIFAITLHEAAHGYVARFFGDRTAEMEGRISLNPIRHIDPIGTILLPLVQFIFMATLNGPGIFFGWAKPVPVNFGNLRDPKRDMLWVAIAGPAMNFLMVIGWVLFLKLQSTVGVNERFFQEMAIAGVRLNVAFMLLNMLPILPLDGGRVLMSLLPRFAAWKYSRLEPYGTPLLLALVFLRIGGVSLLGYILAPFARLTYSLLYLVFGT